MPHGPRILIASLWAVLGALSMSIGHAAVCSDFVAKGKRVSHDSFEPPDIKERYRAFYSQDGRRVMIREAGSNREISSLPYGLDPSIDKPGDRVIADFADDSKVLVKVPREASMAVHEIASGRLIEKLDGFALSLSRFGVIVYRRGPRACARWTPRRTAYCSTIRRQGTSARWAPSTVTAASRESSEVREAPA